MTELEKIEQAKKYLDKLANGTNPLTDAELPADDIVNNVRISRCLFYVAGLLGELLEDNDEPAEETGEEITEIPEPEEDEPEEDDSEDVLLFDDDEEYLDSDQDIRSPFCLSEEERKLFKLSDAPVSISEITNKLNNLIDDPDMERLLFSDLTEWLLDGGYLDIQKLANGRRGTVPTEKGAGKGIILETRDGKNGTYQMILYNKKAQKFILENINYITGAEEQPEENGPEPETEKDIPDADDFEDTELLKERESLCDHCFNRSAGICTPLESKKVCEDYEPTVKNPRELIKRRGHRRKTE